MRLSASSTCVCLISSWRSYGSTCHGDAGMVGKRRDALGARARAPPACARARSCACACARPRARGRRERRRRRTRHSRRRRGARRPRRRTPASRCSAPARRRAADAAAPQQRCRRGGAEVDGRVGLRVGCGVCVCVCAHRAPTYIRVARTRSAGARKRSTLARVRSAVNTMAHAGACATSTPARSRTLSSPANSSSSSSAFCAWRRFSAWSQMRWRCAVEHLGGDLLAGVRGQVVHREGAGRGGVEQRVVDAVVGQRRAARVGGRPRRPC